VSGIIASQAFVPNKISGLKLWLDATDISTISQSGGFVSEWGDKSNGNNAIQSTGVSQPETGSRTINGLNVLDFDGVNDFMVLNSQPVTGPEARSIIIVGFADNGVNNNFFISLTDDDAGDGGVYRISAEMGLRTDGASQLFLAESVENGQAAIITVTNKANSTLELDSDNLQIYRNTVLLTEDISTNPTLDVDTNSGIAAIGNDFGGPSSRSLDGVIGEIIVYDKVLTTFERSQVEIYLGNKWGIFPFIFTSDFSKDFS